MTKKTLDELESSELSARKCSNPYNDKQKWFEGTALDEDDDLDDLSDAELEGIDVSDIVLSADGRGESEEVKATLRRMIRKSLASGLVMDFSFEEVFRRAGIKMEWIAPRSAVRDFDRIAKRGKRDDDE